MRTQDDSAAKTERHVTITRIFDAPRELVFKAWTDPAHMAAWWGPKGFTNPVCDMDVRIGGAIRIVMRGPNGVEYPMTGDFREIIPPERLVFMCVARDAQENPLLESLTTVTFEDLGGKTKLTMDAHAIGIAPIAPQMLAGMEIGWTQSIDRLGDLVAVMKEDAFDREIVSTRVFNFPRELVFEAWSDPVHLARWWGPKGFTNTFHEFDMKPGGVWRFIMHGPNGADYQSECRFIEIVSPERIVLEHVSPPRFRVTATFEDFFGMTLLTFRQRFETREVCDKIKVIAAPANEENFDKLQSELATMGEPRKKKS
jgi:uncharacterized protein YndB with AHSA1/START domain